MNADGPKAGSAVLAEPSHMQADKEGWLGVTIMMASDQQLGIAVMLCMVVSLSNHWLSHWQTYATLCDVVFVFDVCSHNTCVHSGFVRLTGQ